jgi:hypothetical protein
VKYSVKREKDQVKLALMDSSGVTQATQRLSVREAREFIDKFEKVTEQLELEAAFPQIR